MKVRSNFLFLMIFLGLTTITIAQETTGSLEISVKDTNGAVVPSATVVITNAAGSASTAFKRTVATDQNGFQRVLQVPPGLYSITVEAVSGFSEKKIANVPVTLGRATPITIELSSQVGAVVDIVADGTGIDTTDTKIQTNITAQMAELLPKGTNFSSVLKVSPATRPEPLSGGFQVDGASGSENTFIIDGQEVTNVTTGVLNTNSNLPFQLIQEVQVKSSGFEAEYGGATGGVINLVTKGGNNEFHGNFEASFEPGPLQGRGRPILITNTSSEAEYITQGKDGYVGFFPSATLSGPIVKDKVWFFASYTPQIYERQRTINYVNYDSTQSYNARQVNDYTFARIDAQPFSRLRLTGTYTYNPISVEGALPAYSALYGTVPSGSGLVGAEYYNQLGGRQNSQSVTGSAIWNPTNDLIVSFRGGHYFLNEKLGTYGYGDVTIPRVNCSSSSSSEFPTGFGCTRGTILDGVVSFSNTVYDATKRNTFDADATYMARIGGQLHQIKGGYQLNAIGNDLLSSYNDAIVLYYGRTISAISGRSITSSANAVGAGYLRIYNESGSVTSKNQALYIQDKWQPTTRLTLNVGLRAESEDVPSFTEGLNGVNFNWGSKLAPRLGAAYDLTGDGKTKFSAFYGWFYDRFKYELPRGSFGGANYHVMYFEILNGTTVTDYEPFRQSWAEAIISSAEAVRQEPQQRFTG